MEKESCSWGPQFKPSTYRRGPTDVNPSMFPFERKQAEAIEARCGKATDSIEDATKSKNPRFAGPGKS